MVFQYWDVNSAIPKIFIIFLIREISAQINEKNFKWTEIAEKYNKMTPIASITRLGKHCRERWLNHLDPSIKKFSKKTSKFYQTL